MNYFDYLILVSLTVLAAVWDLKYQKIPNFIVFPGMIAGLVLSALKGFFIYRLIGLGILLVISFVVYSCFRGWIGMGDMKLWMMCEMFLGMKASFIIFTLSQFLLLLVVLLKGKGQNVKQGFLSFVFYRCPVEGTEKYSLGIFFMMATIFYMACTFGKVIW